MWCSVSPMRPASPILDPRLPSFLLLVFASFIDIFRCRRIDYRTGKGSDLHAQGLAFVGSQGFISRDGSSGWTFCGQGA